MSARTSPPRRAAFIDEARCIGCALCIEACPFDAILGARRQMHTVLTALCPGCELCIAPCPVDCIAMLPAAGAAATWERPQAVAARQRAKARRLRLAQETERTAQCSVADKRSIVESALCRARSRRAATEGAPGDPRGKRS